MADGLKDETLERRHVPDRICETLNFFAAANGFQLALPDSGLESDLVYNLIEYALAHEASHRLAGDVDHGKKGAVGLAAEIAADTIGFEMYVTSTDWRTELFEQSGAGLSPAEQLVVGPCAFLATVQLLEAYVAALRARLMERLAALRTRLPSADVQAVD